MGGVSTYSVGNVLSRSAEKFRRGNLYCCSIFGYWKSLDKKGVEYQHFPSKIFVSQCRKYSHVNPSGLCFRKLLVAKNLWIRGGGVSRYSVEKFLFHSAEKLRRGTL